MKLRSTLLVLAVLLMMASLASAAQTATPTDAASANLAAIFAAPAPPDGGAAKLPSFEPAPTNKAVTCGSCSDSLCQGKAFNTVCKVQGTKIYKCEPAYVICAPTDCECWNGPLP